MEKDPLLKKNYDELAVLFGPEPVPDETPDWAKLGPPPALPAVASLGENALRQREYATILQAHKKLITDTRAAIAKDTVVAEKFRETFVQLGLRDLHQEYFPPAMPIVLQSAANASTLVFSKYVLRPEIKAAAQRRKIPHLIHFTDCRNLRSILRNGLMPKSDWQAWHITGLTNDDLRLDGHLDAISLSVTFPNYKMFYKYRKLRPEAEWAVILLKPDILWSFRCGFYPKNAAHSTMRVKESEEAESLSAFESLFDAKLSPRPDWLRACDPTDPQAEVLAYGHIAPYHIETIAFETLDVAKKWAPHLGGCDYISAGLGKGLFAPRSQVRKASDHYHG